MVPSNRNGALVIDASVAVAISARESNRDVLANGALRKFAGNGYVYYAPGVIVTEVLFALCNQHKAGLLTVSEFDQAVTEFGLLMLTIQPPPQGDAALVNRIHDLGKGYGCSRSADGAYITLAEELARIVPTVLITFDQELPKQAARHAPAVSVQLL